ncbi:MAG: cell division ATP-binding protein FtsE [Candidatus Thiothrix putei]|jgi:cell division ATP-binding protein FtsE|uniref:Cell division ATP-binding protein FtsE n=2 Tax=Thiothrix TaxID=1030 RepID=A0A1H4BEC9_9GAMM|nr:cell division ATP-binding protein FtsE [Thiothrix caldifontis]WGZ95357.1 MAG: cell division ATP-binding protein FtsE [Candidatus Thiothrix putei]SEA46456.1 cell division transport system ATP-binding protein [Thiothrix caldifontis]
MIEFKQVSKKYPTGQLALYNINLTLEAGEMVFITGHSGAGKSTLLKLVAMLERPSKGEVLIGGRSLSKLGRGQIPNYRRRIGFIFQDPHLLYDRSVFDNIALPLRIAGMGQSETRRRVQAALDKVGLTGRETTFPLMLSAGEKQRVGIARAMVNKPTIILADEPTGNLDPELAQDIMFTFAQFNELGATVMIASHDHGLVERMKKRTIVLQKVD